MLDTKIKVAHITKQLQATISTILIKMKIIKQNIKQALGEAYVNILFSFDNKYKNIDYFTSLTSQVVDDVKRILTDDPIETFVNMNGFEREEVIIQIVEQCIETMRIEIKDLIFREDLDSLNGFYDSKKELICIDQTIYQEQLSHQEAREYLNSLFHELFHAYQVKASFDTSYGVDAKTTSIWRNNMKNYVTFQENPVRYYNQPLEIDARAFGAAIISML